MSRNSKFLGSLGDSITDDVFQVYRVHGDGSRAKAYTLSDLAGRTEGLGFSQPVAYDRLTPVEMLPLAAEAEDIKTRIIVTMPSGAEKEGVIEAQSVDGKVHINFNDGQGASCYDLSSTQYRWL